MKKLSVLLSVLMVVLLFAGCDLFDRDDDVPPLSSSVNQPASDVAGGDVAGNNASNAGNTVSNNAPTGSGTGDSASQLTRDETLDIALREAGVSRDAIRDLEAELDRDNGRLVWEIDFDSGNMEYSYDINAETGAVVERDRERDNR